MFETYNEIGIDSIQITDLVNGVASFFMVALGGVFIGMDYLHKCSLLSDKEGVLIYVSLLFIFRSNMGILNRFSYKIH